MISKPVYFKIHEPEADFNTSNAEINPIISGDGKTLVFTRQMQFYDGVFISVKQQNDSWSKPINLTPDFGLDGNSYNTGISFRGDEIFAYRSDDFDGNIYSSKLIKNKWSKLEKLNDNINTKFWESHASPSPDGEYLYFTSNRAEGYGGLDIYKSQRGRNGTWGPAINLGPIINTSLNEDTPFVTNEGYSLFFSSQGHNTIGGYDVFISNLLSDGKWGKAQNMGYPFNTTDDDLFYSPTGVNAYGYLSKFENVVTKGLSDIFLVEVYNEMIPRVFTINGKLDFGNLDSKAYKKVTVSLLKKGSNEIAVHVQPESDGTFKLSAPQGSYNLIVEGENIQPYMQSIELSVTQAESVLALSSIMLSSLSSVAQPLAVIQPTMQVIIAKRDFYAVSDSSPIAIELVLPRDASLHIDILQNNNLAAQDEKKFTKRRFVYIYKPKPGDNLLKFTAIDRDSNISATEVMVKYYLSENLKVVKDTLVTSKPVEPRIAILSQISTGNLRDYLLSLEKEKFSNIFELYKYLLANAAIEGITSEEINKMFAVYFSQKDLSTFIRALKQQLPFDTLKCGRLQDSSAIPLQFIQRLQKDKLYSNSELELSLIKLLYLNPDNAENLINRLNLYSDIKYPPQLMPGGNQVSWDGFEIFKENTTSESATNALNLASSSEGLDYFFQNLMVASSGPLLKYLAGLSLPDNKIETSIDLVLHLFENAGKYGYTTEELIKSLELASANKLYYLQKFNEFLSDRAEGSLKSQLLTLNVENQNIQTYEELISYMLKQSDYKKQNRGNVYNLLLNLIGIKDVNEFADKIRSYKYAGINKALDDTTISYFSSPFELIQYLLASVNTYNFSESDINNLLIRMLLERGLQNKGENILSPGKIILWKTPKFISTVVLVNILIIFLIIIFSRRQKKNNNKK
jgi:hypothetical protein